MTIVDARVRLPFDLRPREQARPEHLSERYDAILSTNESATSTFADLLRDMDAAGVTRAVLHAEYEYGDPADALNEAVAGAVERDPERFAGFGTVSQEGLGISRALGQLEQIAASGLAGVNLQPAFFDMALDDRRLYAIYSKALELGLTVALHTGVNYSTRHPIDGERPLLLDRVATDLPELTLVACHAGWPWAAEMVAVMRRHPNVLADFGGMAPRYVGEPGTGWEVMHRAMRSLVPDQVLFATDWPVFAMQRAVEEWRGLGLGERALSASLSTNAERIWTRAAPSGSR